MELYSAFCLLLFFWVEISLKCLLLNKQKNSRRIKKKKNKAEFQSHRSQQGVKINSKNDAPFPQFPEAGLVKVIWK